MTLLSKIKKELDQAAEVTAPGDMSDNGQDMDNEERYIFNELKDAVAFIIPALEGKATKKELLDSIAAMDVSDQIKKYTQDLLNFCEKKYASASDLALVAKHSGGGADHTANINLIASQLDNFASKSEVVQLASYVSGQIDAIKTNTVDVTLSAAQVLALGSTAITIVPAPGAGKYVEVVRVEMFLDYNSAAYTGAAGKDVSIEHSSGGTPLVSIGCSGLMDQTSDQRRCMNHATDHDIVMNEAVVVKTLNGNLAAGNSPFKIRVDYRLITALV